jgi:hypothetical protein
MSVGFIGSLRGTVLVGVCGLLVCESVSDSQAEDLKPKDFYQHNYAVAPGYEGAERIGGSSGTQTRATAPSVQEPHTNQGRISSLPKLRRETKKPVVYVFVNSLERTHFNRVIQEAIRLHDAKRAVVVGVFHIGDYESMTPQIQQELNSREIGYYQAEAVFRELFAESSPTWVVSTQQGRHVAEGFLEIYPFFDEWGEYSPKRVEEPEDRSTMEGF